MKRHQTRHISAKTCTKPLCTVNIFMLIYPHTLELQHDPSRSSFSNNLQDIGIRNVHTRIYVELHSSQGSDVTMRSFPDKVPIPIPSHLDFQMYTDRDIHTSMHPHRIPECCQVTPLRTPSHTSSEPKLVTCTCNEYVRTFRNELWKA